MVSMLMFGKSQSPGLRLAPRHQGKEQQQERRAVGASAWRRAAPTSQGQVSREAARAAMAAGGGEVQIKVQQVEQPHPPGSGLTRLTTYNGLGRGSEHRSMSRKVCRTQGPHNLAGTPATVV